MVGLEFSRFQHHVQRKSKNDEHGSENGVKWNQDIQKERPELIFDAMKASAKKCSKKVTRNSPGWPATARDCPGAFLGAPNKGKT